MKMAREGASIGKIVDRLTSEGVHEATADSVARSVWERCHVARTSADKRMGWTLLALGAGTLVTYLAAEDGGVYYIALGPLLYRSYRLLRGFVRVTASVPR